MNSKQSSSPVLTLAVITALLLPIAIVGVRLGLWPFRLSFLLLLAAGVMSIVVMIMLAFTVLHRHRREPPSGRLLALLLGVLPLLFLLNPAYRAFTHPMIHDITTDLLDPPKFAEVALQRMPEEHPVDYAGAELAAIQRAAYPDIQPQVLPETPEQIQTRLLPVLNDMGFDILANVPEEGRIEAVQTSLLFGFKDDVVIRIRPWEGGTRVDIRSMSRVGKSDLGVNAERIRKIQQALYAAVD